ncbi:hypothetical protein HBI72_030600 [Parastagonospora nodorum]|nr:hypothetical protein HBI72_030600 [Parastagonospora nodorum]
MCAKDDLEVLFQTHNRRLAEELATAESVTAKDPNYVDTFSLDFAFSFIIISIRPLIARGNVSNANILLLIAFIISYRSFADKLNIQQSLLDRATVVLIIISVNKIQLLLILGDRSTPSTLLARFIPITKIRDLLLKTLENAAKSRILLACADGRTRQCYLTICAILADYEEQVLLTSVKKNRYCTRCTHYNFNIHVSLATDTLHLLLKGLVMKMLDFMQDMLDNIYPGTVVSPLFVLKAPFALHFIRAVCDLVTLAQYKSYDEDTLAYIQGALERINHALTHIIQDIRIYGALDSICTRANNRTYSTRVIRPLPFRRLRWSILGIQPHSTKLPLSEVAANIAISNFTHAAARSSGKRHNDPEHCDEEVHGDNRRQSRTVTDSRVVAQLHLILTIIDYTRYDKDGKHIAYIRAFSEVLLFNNNRQIDNTTGMLTFKFYDLSTIIRSVHLVLRDLPNLTTYKYNRLYSLTFDINLLRTLREYRQKRTRNN